MHLRVAVRTPLTVFIRPQGEYDVQDIRQGSHRLRATPVTAQSGQLDRKDTTVPAPAVIRLIRTAPMSLWLIGCFLFKYTKARTKGPGFCFMATLDLVHFDVNGYTRR